MAYAESDSAVIQAAGGVLTRPGAAGREVMLVHRKRYDDWTLPKGKVERGEQHAEAALREVREETGCEAVCEKFLGAFGYEVHGRPKIVLFWEMKLVSQSPLLDNDEVDEAVWLPLSVAVSRMSYSQESSLVSGLISPPSAVRETAEINSKAWGWSWIMGKRSYARLLREFETFRTELAFLEAQAGRNSNWSVAAHHSLDALERRIRNEDVEAGWHLLNQAKRWTLYGFNDVEILNRALVLFQESEKLTPWRKDAVRGLLSGLKERPPAVAIENLVEATRLRDEHAEDRYHKIWLMADQLGILLWLAFVAPVSLLLILVGILAHSDQTLASLVDWDWHLILAVLLFGILGAGFSAAQSIIRSSAKNAPIPERVSNHWVTTARALFGAVAGLAGYAFLQSKIFSTTVVDGKIGSMLAISFLFGFTGEKLILGIVAKAVGGNRSDEDQRGQ
jgi:ADP-ribose pyrophosphatase YjhB (NUDIX family)